MEYRILGPVQVIDSGRLKSIGGPKQRSVLALIVAGGGEAAEPPSSPNTPQKSDERLVAVYEAVRAHELELNRATAAFEHAVIAPLTLVNGGAAAAWLALLGDRGDIVGAWRPAVVWGVGLVLAVLAAHLGWRRQRAYAVAERYRREAWELLWLSPQPSAADLATITTNAEFRRKWDEAIEEVREIRGRDHTSLQEARALALTEQPWQAARLMSSVSSKRASNYSLYFQSAIAASVVAFVTGAVWAGALI